MEKVIRYIEGRIIQKFSFNIEVSTQEWVEYGVAFHKKGHTKEEKNGTCCA